VDLLKNTCRIDLEGEYINFNEDYDDEEDSNPDESCHHHHRHHHSHRQCHDEFKAVS